MGGGFEPQIKGGEWRPLLPLRPITLLTTDCSLQILYCSMATTDTVIDKVEFSEVTAPCVYMGCSDVTKFDSISGAML